MRTPTTAATATSATATSCRDHHRRPPPLAARFRRCRDHFGRSRDHFRRARHGGRGSKALTGQRRRQIRARRKAFFGILGHRLGDHGVEFRQLRSPFTDQRRCRGQVLADDHRRVGVLERGGPGEQVERGTAERVLVGTRVEIVALQLLGRAVGGRPHQHVRRGQTADLAHLAGDAEIGEQDAPSGAGRRTRAQQDVGGFDVTMQQSA